MLAPERASVVAGTAIHPVGHRAEIASFGYSRFRFRPDSPDRPLARRPLSGVAWPRPRRPTNRGVPRRPRSARSCAITSRPSACRPRVCATEKACPASSSTSSETFCSVAGLPAGSRDFAVVIAASTGSSHFRAKAVRSVRVAAGRRMTERAAHLLDHVFPDVPVRQCRGPRRGSRAGVEWVLSLPYRLRYQLAWNHDLCRGVVAVFLRAVLGFLRARARDGGVADARGGAVAVIQRFGGSPQFKPSPPRARVGWRVREDPTGALNFHPVPRLTALGVAEVLARVEPRIKRLPPEVCAVGAPPHAARPSRLARRRPEVTVGA